MLRDLKQVIQAWKSSNVAELKNSALKSRPKLLHKDVIANTWFQLLINKLSFKIWILYLFHFYLSNLFDNLKRLSVTQHYA